jgi:hypothetical protein
LTFPSVPGAVHEHVAVVEAADADAQITDEPSLKLTVPALGTVAVIITVPDAAAVLAELGSAIDTDVDALLTVIVNVFVPTWLLPSVARTLCEYVPAVRVLLAVTAVPESVTPEITDPSDHV